MRLHRLAYIPLITLTATNFIFGNFSYAESNQAPSIDDIFELSIEDLMDTRVTIASFFDESDKDVASSVSVISKKDWKRWGARTPTQAVSHTSNIQVLNSFSASEIPIIRGFTSTTSARGVLTQFEGVPLNSFALGTAAYDVDNISLGTLNKIEVIRGPGSALYGADAFHGVIGYQGHSSDKAMTGIDVSIGNKGIYQTTALHSTKAFEATNINFALSLNGQGQQNNKYKYSDPISSTNKVAEYDNNYETATIHFKSSSSLNQSSSLTTNLLFNHHDATSFPGLAFLCQPASLPANKLPRDCYHNADKKISLAKIGYQNKLTPDLIFETNFFHWRTKALRILPRVTLGAFIREEQIADEQRSGVKAILKQSKEQLEYVQKWALGLEYTHQKMDEFKEIVNGVNTTLNATDQLKKGDSRNYPSLFAQAESRLFSESLKAVYGFRLDDYKSFGEQYTPRLGVIYSHDKINTFKILWGNAFRAPTGFELKGTSVIRGDENIEPEELESYEIVWSRNHEQSKQTFTLFNNFVENIIQVAPNPNLSGNPIQYFNDSDKNVSYGIEIEHQQFIEYWHLAFNMSYTKSKNEESGEDFVAFPRRIANITIGRNIQSLDLDFYVANQYQDGMNESPNSKKQLKPFWTTNIYLNKNITSQTSLYLALKNAFDRENSLPAVWSQENGIPQGGINIELGANAKF